MPRTVSSWLLNITKDGDSTTSLGNLPPVFDHPRFPLSLLCSRLDSPSSLSLSSCRRCSSPGTLFVALRWTVSLCLSCTGKAQTGLNAPGVTSPMLSRGEGPTPSVFWRCTSLGTFRWLSTRTPRSFSLKLLSSQSASSRYWCVHAVVPLRVQDSALPFAEPSSGGSCQPT